MAVQTALLLAALFILIFTINSWYAFYLVQSGADYHSLKPFLWLLDFYGWNNLAALNSPPYLLILITVICAAIIVGVGVVMSRYFSIKRRSHLLNKFLLDIPRCPDGEFLEYCQKLGIEISPEEIIIPVKLLQNVKPAALAKTLATLLYLNYREIKEYYDRQHYTVFHSLAELLLKYWAEPQIQSFIKSLTEEKEYLGSLLSIALNRVLKENEVSQIQNDLDQLKEMELSTIQGTASASRFKYSSLID